jgi:hypothetical protein
MLITSDPTLSYISAMLKACENVDTRLIEMCN